MAIYTVKLQEDLDFSIGIGDVLYYISFDQMALTTVYDATSGTDSVQETLQVATEDSIKALGTITRIGPIAPVLGAGVEYVVITPGLLKQEVEFDSIASAEDIALMTENDFLFFRKNQVVNKSGLKGYYMEIDFKNNKNAPVELFSIGSNVVESSK
tara:strand:- start:1098 stop:1565 length:468 start_codon:yes stop_codon:yes gene_type:complete